MVDLEKTKLMISKFYRWIPVIVILFNIFAFCPLTYAGWYEEPPAYEMKNFDNMWWISKKKKAKLKEEQEAEYNKILEEYRKMDVKDKKIRWLYNDSDNNMFPVDKFEIIDEDNDGIGYKYYFDKDGFLITDTITDDYKIVDSFGRELDYNFVPKKYNMENLNNNQQYVNDFIEIKDENTTTKKSDIIISGGVTLNEKSKIFDGTIDKNVINYVDASNRFIKETKGIVYNEIKWKKCSSLRGNDGYVIFNNPNNNFNRISGIIATEYYIYDDETVVTLKVYDADIYEHFNEINQLDDLVEIYSNSSFNRSEPLKFSFTFDRAIKRLRFVVETQDKDWTRTCYMKNLKFGFDKMAFIDELARKKENEEEIAELKRLGIYTENTLDILKYNYTDQEESDDDSIYLEDVYYEDEYQKTNFTDDEYDKDFDTHEEILRNRNSGPMFDDVLREIPDSRYYGPSFVGQ
jgi:hypothetical protein